ncbi:hypothetical protein ACFPIF_09935 [Brevundimonas faecalis]|uniref:hypothetical protein n=1 Tax=Brevundimonas faecalis TaxID=947378 RepID=UPI003609E1CE
MTTPAPAWADWPDVLQQVAEACGAGAALRLAASYGGRELYLPRPETITEGHHLAVQLGLATARRIAETLREGKIVIPMGPTNSAARRAELMRRMKRERATIAQTAKAVGLHERSVYRRHQRDRDAGLTFRDCGTLDMFED